MLKTRYFLTVATILLSAALVSGRTKHAAADDTPPADLKQDKFIAVLASKAPAPEKAMACKKLALCGGKEAVPALAALLADKELASWARIALEAIPDAAADVALRQSLDKLQGRLLVGVINSIGVRRDGAALDPLSAQLKNADAEVAAAAAVALGHIGGEKAVKLLEPCVSAGPAAVRSAAAEGCLLCAERLLADGNRAEALRLYDAIRRADLPQPRIIEATRGAILARQAAGVPLLLEQLRSPDKLLFRLGLAVARELPGPEATAALVAELGHAAPERQPMLVLVLIDRGDAAALPAMLQAAKSGPDAMRIAALHVVERVGDASCVPTLLEAVLDADADVSQAAVDALAALPGKEINAELATRLPKAEGKARLILIELAGRRANKSSAASLLKYADATDAHVRVAALSALGEVIDQGDLPLLISRAASPPSAEEGKAALASLATACPHMPDRDACADKLAAALAKSSGPTRLALLEIMGAVGGGKSLQVVGAAAGGADAEIRDVAIRLLGQWMNADAGPVLLKVAQTAGDDKLKTRALRGYLRIARQLQLSAPARLAMCREAAPLCRRNEEKELLIATLRRTPSAESLTLLLPELHNGALQAEAGAAAVTIAKQIVASQPSAVAEAMKQVIQSGGGAELTTRAKELLKQATSP